MTDWQRFIPAGILGVGCLLIGGIREQARIPLARPISEAAVEMPGYKTTDLPISAEEQKIAGMTNYLLRSYSTDSIPAFSVYVGYYDYQVQGKTIHSPRNCLPGAGWEPLRSEERRVSDGEGHTVPINRYLMAKGRVQALVYYWYQGRGRVEANEYKVKVNLMRDAALSGRTEEALVRIVVPVDPKISRTARDEAAYAGVDSLATSIATQLISRVNKVLPSPPGA
jgi:EpsI family protein